MGPSMSPECKDGDQEEAWAEAFKDHSCQEANGLQVELEEDAGTVTTQSTNAHTLYTT